MPRMSDLVAVFFQSDTIDTIVQTKIPKETLNFMTKWYVSDDKRYGTSSRGRFAMTEFQPVILRPTDQRPCPPGFKSIDRP